MEETEPTLCRKPCFEAVLYGLLSRISRLTLVQQVGTSDGVVLQVSNADKFVAERLWCVLRLPNRKGCR
jgi:hypothetical protein